MKAYHAFLVHNDGTACTAVRFENETLAFVEVFNDKALKRHAASELNRPLSGFPPGLESMRLALGHGLEGNAEVRPLSNLDIYLTVSLVLFSSCPTCRVLTHRGVAGRVRFGQLLRAPEDWEVCVSVIIQARGVQRAGGVQTRHSYGAV